MLGVINMNTGVGEGNVSREKKVLGVVDMNTGSDRPQQMGIGSPVDRVGVATSKSSIQELNSDPSSQLRLGTAKEWTNIVDWKDPSPTRKRVNSNVILYCLYRKICTDVRTPIS